MKIGIFGGSFNPPHKMHESIAAYLTDNNILDKVIFVPTGSKYKYKNNLESDKDRYNMVSLITGKHDNFETSDFELKSEVVYTYETLKHFKEEYTNADIYFICGLDNLSHIDSWKNAEYILNNFKILVIRRNTDDLEEVLNRLDKYKNNIIVVDMEENAVSSTMLRSDILSDNASVYLDKDVLQYIKDNNLYR